MEDPYLGDQRIELEDYEAIDRAMLDCFSETGHLESMDYLSTPSFNMMNNLFNQSQQRGAYSYNKDVQPRRHSSTLAAINQPSVQMPMHMSSHNMQYPGNVNLSDWDPTSSSSDFSTCLTNQIRHPSLVAAAGPEIGSSNKRKLSASNMKYEVLPSEAVPTKSELKSQHVIVSRERRRERNKFLARKTRVKKKAEIESLWAQVSQLRTENERLKESVRVSAPKTTETILQNCEFKLPKKVSDLVDKMIATGCLPGITKSSLRSFCITNATAPDCPIVYASRDFVELTGYEMYSILGHNCRFLQGPDTDRKELNKLKEAIQEGREETVIIKNYRRNGTPFWNRTYISPMRDERGNVTMIIGLQTEVYRSHDLSQGFTTMKPCSSQIGGNLGNHSCNGSTTGRSDSNGSSNHSNESRTGSGSSEDGTTDGTNDEESESHNGSTNGSEIDSHST